MKTIQDKIEDTIKSTVNVNNFDREHIFYSIINSLDNHLSIDEKMNLFHLFLLLQKSFKCLLFDDNNLFKYYQNKINFENLNLEKELAKTAINAIYYPIIAFKDYDNRDYVKSREKINLSIKNLDCLILNGCIDCINAKMEQNLNLIRLHISEENFLESKKIALEIIDYIQSKNKATLSYEIPFDKVVPNEHEQYSILCYYFDSIMLSFLKNEKNITFEFLDEVVKLKSNDSFDMINALYYIKEIYNDNSEEYRENQNILNINFSNIPFILQFLIIEKLKERVEIEVDDRLLKKYFLNFQFYNKAKKINLNAN